MFVSHFERVVSTPFPWTIICCITYKEVESPLTNLYKICICVNQHGKFVLRARFRNIHKLPYTYRALHHVHKAAHTFYLCCGSCAIDNPCAKHLQIVLLSQHRSNLFSLICILTWIIELSPDVASWNELMNAIVVSGSFWTFTSRYRQDSGYEKLVCG